MIWLIIDAISAVGRRIRALGSRGITENPQGTQPKEKSWGPPAPEKAAKPENEVKWQK